MQYGFGPTIGAGVNVTLMTYRDTCAIGINADGGAIPDFEVFQECLVAGFEEVLALAATDTRARPRRTFQRRRPTTTPRPHRLPTTEMRHDPS